MNSITTDQTIQFTKSLKILYVEDDLDLQSQTKEFFEILFASVTVASDGEEALEKYQHEYFDIVISDIKMPKMDGIELSKKIKEINPSQYIIIVSAYNDSRYLVTFINLNIRQFIQKPIDVDDMLQTLYFTSKNIVNEKMVEKYREDLEKSNNELTQKNEELNSLIRILDAKLLQIGQNTKQNSNESDLKVINIKNNDLAELKEIETDISVTVALLNSSKNLDIEKIKVLGEMFLSYSKILKNYDTYSELANNMKKMGQTLNNAPETFMQRIQKISIFLESLIYVLKVWRNNLVNKETRKAMDLHSSMINDVETIISIIDATDIDTQNNMSLV